MEEAEAAETTTTTDTSVAAGEEAAPSADAGDSTMKQEPSETTTTTYKRLYVPVPLRAPELVQRHRGKDLYWDRSHYESHEAQMAALHKSSTLYVGNLAFTTQSRHVWQHFALLGAVHKVHMGLDRIKKKPCGFCFVEYRQRQHALQAVSLLSGTKLDGSIIRVELDAGFQQGRQYGRGARGGQVRHDRKPPNHNNNKRMRESHPPPPPPPPQNPYHGGGDAAAPEGDGGYAPSAPSDPGDVSYTPSAPSDPADAAAGGNDYYGQQPEAGDAEMAEEAPAAKRQKTEE